MTSKLDISDPFQDPSSGFKIGRKQPLNRTVTNGTKKGQKRATNNIQKSSSLSFQSYKN